MNLKLANKVTRHPESAQALEDMLAVFHETYGELPNDDEMDVILDRVARAHLPSAKLHDRITVGLGWALIICIFVITPLLSLCQSLCNQLETQTTQTTQRYRHDRQ